jgi:hypothetical protein
MCKKNAVLTMFFILGLVLLFHFLIYFEQIPYDKVWAGKLNTVEEMKSFETFSILMNIFMMIIFFIKYKQLESEKSNKIVGILIWIFAFLFGLNTIGNLFSKNCIELILGTFLTLLATILCVIIVKNNKIK